jgi:hypothetical protein
VPDKVLNMFLLHSVWSSLVVAGALVVVQVAADVRHDANLRRLKYVQTGLWVECKQLFDPQAYHLFLSHACASSARHGATAADRILKPHHRQISRWQGQRRRTTCAPSKRACSSVCRRAAPFSTSTATLCARTPARMPCSTRRADCVERRAVYVRRSQLGLGHGGARQERVRSRLLHLAVL